MTKNSACETTEAVFAAVKELRAMQQPANREAVERITGLKMAIVDDRLRVLVNDHKRLYRIERGLYELVEVFPEPRAISKTILPSGMVVYDIGNEVIQLTPQEARVLGELSVGAAASAIMIKDSDDFRVQLSQQATTIKVLQGQIKALEYTFKASKNIRQMALLDR